MLDSVSSVVFFQLIQARGREELLRFLPPSELEKVQTTQLPSRDPFSAWLSTEKRLARIHYSWLIPFFQSLGAEDKKLLISSLPSVQKEGLTRYFKFKDLQTFSRQKAREYPINLVYRWVISQEQKVLPVEYLPEYRLNGLIHLNKQQLQTLIDYLGLYDLALELKQIVQSEQIKKIQTVLSKDQRHYLKESIYGKQHLTFARLHLDRWKGDENGLKRVLHQRGLNRLAKALFGAHPSLLWHISHRLDTGRAKLLYRYLIDIKNEEARLILIDQVLHLIKHIESMEIK